MDRYARIAFYLAAAFAFVMASLAHPPVLPGQPDDKLLHTIAFAVLGTLAALGFRQRSSLALLLLLGLFGAMIELVQAIPALNRDSDPLDLLADVVAAAAALWLTRMIARRPARAQDATGTHISFRRKKGGTKGEL